MDKHIVLSECALTFDANIGECTLIATNGTELSFPMSQDAWNRFLSAIAQSQS